MKNKKEELINNILILGLKSEELNKLQSLDIDEIEELSSKYKAVILDNYESTYISKNARHDDEFYKNICEYSFPGGVVNSSENININKKQYITFCIKYNKEENINKLKHITCAYIQSGLKIKDKNIITINTGIALISSLDIYECHKEILSHFIDIITNYFINNSTITSNKKNMEIYITNIQPEQKITHFVEETSELICIHCAFNKLKNNQNIQIKEIPEKCKEYLNIYYKYSTT